MVGKLFNFIRPLIKDDSDTPGDDDADKVQPAFCPFFSVAI